MKNLLAISLIFVVLLASLSHTSIWLAFKVNQSDIIERFCINKNAPEKHCDGKCYLSDRLAENTGDSEHPSPFTQFEESLKINFYASNFHAAEVHAESPVSAQNFAVEQLLTQLYLSSDLQPPESAFLPC